MSDFFWTRDSQRKRFVQDPLPGKYRGQLASPFMLVHGVRPIQELGSLSFRYAIFITRRTATPHIPSCKPTQWSVSSLVVHPPLTQSWFTIPKVSATTNPTATSWTCTASHPPCIPRSSTTVVYSSRSTATTTLLLVNHTLQEHGSSRSTPTPTSALQAQ